MLALIQSQAVQQASNAQPHWLQAVIMPVHLGICGAVHSVAGDAWHATCIRVSTWAQHKNQALEVFAGIIPEIVILLGWSAAAYGIN